MIDESLLKTNFVGKDGFRWWVGQIAPSAAQGEQLAPKKGGKTWGNRLKVRIMGYHPFQRRIYLMKIYHGLMLCFPLHQEREEQILQNLSN